MSLDLPASLEFLAHTPSVLDSLLRGTPSSWHAANEGPETWSPVDVIGHLIHGEETDWVPRARIILEHGQARVFEPFDRFAQFTRFAGWPLAQLLDRFSALRRDNVATVRGWQLTSTQLALVGRHPELGLVSLGQLLAAWVGHDLNHLTQINRALAGQLAHEVGPWRAYLSILKS